MTPRMLSRLPKVRRAALLRRIRERLYALEAMDRSLSRLGESIDPDDVLTEIVAILDEACPRVGRRTTAA